MFSLFEHRRFRLAIEGLWRIQHHWLPDRSSPAEPAAMSNAVAEVGEPPVAVVPDGPNSDADPTGQPEHGGSARRRLGHRPNAKPLELANWKGLRSVRRANPHSSKETVEAEAPRWLVAERAVSLDGESATMIPAGECSMNCDEIRLVTSVRKRFERRSLHQRFSETKNEKENKTSGWQCETARPRISFHRLALRRCSIG